ncbi:MAG: SAM-dependent methyltransferase [Gammaproteobacteria bacterium]|nr:SAM-dependent methyltransferase [Gammaproteobacteria bacterium]
MSTHQLSASFRDPSGFLFNDNGKILRQVNLSYREHYDKLMASGLYDSLTNKGWLVAHEELPADNFPADQSCYKILLPEQIPYISYPYEWCFSQLQDAAILTLDIQLEALKHGMVLKDGSAYNVQFSKGKPVFIDTLSFETYREGEPWIAYRQYCQHFLAPLALIAQCDYRLLHLLRANIDGIPLDLASKLLPIKTWFSYSLLAHIHLHAKSQKRFEDSARSAATANRVKISRVRLEGLVVSLLSSVKSLQWKYADTEWGGYYADTNYVDESMRHKEEVVANFLDSCRSKGNNTVADFGANTGKFSRLAADRGFFVLSHDVDEVAVDKNYREISASSEELILPLILDLTNPSPALGWANKERSSFIERQRVDVGMALAIIHHIAISNNVPLDSIAQLFATICRSLIIEFVPKSDSQVNRLLATRADVFPNYNQEDFETTFQHYFRTIEAVPVKNSERTLYLMEVI